MAGSVTFTSHRKKVERSLSVAISRAMNKSVISARAVGARLIARDIGWRIGSIRKRLRIKPSRPETLEMTLSIRGRGIPLLFLGARGPEPSRGRGQGVTYKSGGKRVREPKAFIAKSTRTGRRGVFKRKAVSRYPIEFQVGPSLPDVFSKTAVVDAIVSRYREAMTKNLKHEVDFEIQRQ
jgi:hypothetical protein